MVGCYLGFGRRLKEEAASKEKNPKRRGLGFLVRDVECGLERGEVVLLGLVPVNGIPPGFEVIGAAVLVVEIISVLPDVAADDGRAFHAGHGLTHEGAVLVGGGDDFELAVVDHEPSPTAAEARGPGLFKGLLESVEAAEFGVDRLGEFAPWVHRRRWGP